MAGGHERHAGQPRAALCRARRGRWRAFNARAVGAGLVYLWVCAVTLAARPQRDHGFSRAIRCPAEEPQRAQRLATCGHC